MEIIKKQVVQRMTTGATTGCSSCFVFIPDMKANYNFKLLLTAESLDFGFFDAYIEKPTISPYYYNTNQLFYEIPIGLENLL